MTQQPSKQSLDIVSAYKRGEKQADIAKRYGISKQRVSYVVRRARRKESK